MADSTQSKKLPYGWNITFLIFSIFFLILGGVNLVLYGIASENKQANPPITYENAVIMIVLNSVLVALSLIIMIFMIVKIHQTSSSNFAITSLENRNVSCDKLFSNRNDEIKCQNIRDQHPEVSAISLRDSQKR